MKYVLLLLIMIYQHSISIAIRNILGISSVCRFSLSCSEYARKSILKYGALKGAYLSTIRILTCQPFKI